MASNSRVIVSSEQDITIKKRIMDKYKMFWQTYLEEYNNAVEYEYALGGSPLPFEVSKANSPRIKKIFINLPDKVDLELLSPYELDGYKISDANREIAVCEKKNVVYSFDHYNGLRVSFVIMINGQETHLSSRTLYDWRLITREQYNFLDKYEKEYKDREDNFSIPTIEEIKEYINQS